MKEINKANVNNLFLGYGKRKKTTGKKPTGKKTTGKKTTGKKAIGKKKGGNPPPSIGALSGQSEPTTEQKIIDPLEVYSFSPPGLYMKAQIGKQILDDANSAKVGATQEDLNGLRRLVQKTQQQEMAAQDNIYNVRRNPYDINQDPYNVDNKALETGRNFDETNDLADISADADADAAALGDAADVGEALEGLADFFGLAFGGKKKSTGNKSGKAKKKKTQAQWTRKRNSLIKMAKKKKKIRGGSFWSDIGDFFENLPTDVEDGFITIHDAFTGNNSFGPKLDLSKLPVWNTWGLTQDQINQDIFNSPTPALTNELKRVHHPTFQRYVPGVIGSNPEGNSMSIKGGATKEPKEKTPDEIALAEANKRMRDAKRRFDNAVREYYTDYKQRLIDENNIDRENKEDMKSLAKHVAWHKKVGMDKLKTRLAWAHANAYADELNALLNSRPQYIPNKTGLGKKKTVAKKKKPVPKKKKAAPKKKKPVAKKKTVKKK